MINYINRGSVITVQDTLHTGKYKQFKNNCWQGMPEIISLTDYLRNNYTLEYGKYIRKLHKEHTLPLPYYEDTESQIVNVTITDGKYDRIDSFSFIMYVICDVHFTSSGFDYHQQYCVSGYFYTYKASDFLNDVRMYNGERIRCKDPLDEFLIPVMSTRRYEGIAQEILENYYSKEIGYVYRVDGRHIANAMGYDIQYLRLSLKGNIKSKLIFDKKDVVVYDKDGKQMTMLIPDNTILVDKSLIDDDKLDNVIIHECVHIYLHYLFYYVQSLYRHNAEHELPEFLDYFYSATQKQCIRWLETQANSIARRIQMPEAETTDVIINFIDRYGEMTFEDYRGLIDHIKNTFGVSRYAAKKRIVELGWTEVRGVYTYCTAGYVDDHEIDKRFPMDCTYTLPLRHIAEVFGESSEFAALVSSGKYIYIDGHMCRNDEKYVIKEYGVAFGLTEYAKHHMSECCILFKQIYGEVEYSYTYGELNKEGLSLILEYTLNNEQKNKLRQALKERSSDEIILTANGAANPLAEAVKFHMKRCGVTSEQLIERSGLGMTTITRLRKGVKVKLETILAFSVALELEKSYMYNLMNKAGLQFNYRDRAHNMYLTILDLMPNANVFQINEFLREEGFTPWTQEREQNQINKAI